MIQITHGETYGWEAAMRGMRNPLESHKKADSEYEDEVSLGDNDLKLATKLSLAGSDHAKFLRQIFVTADINAPLYWWKEMDTYKVGTVANSESTMHRLSKSPITLDMFSFDNFVFAAPVIDLCESLRTMYITTGDKQYWRMLIQLLPSAWNQKRTWSANYQVLKNIYHARKNHKLTEWHEFCAWIESLPYAKELIVDAE